LSKDEAPHLALSHAMTTKTNNPRKAASKNTKAKMSKTAKGKATLTKGKSKAKGKNSKNTKKGN
jgi:hypothetical protein